jgi:hypothetical protein
VNIIEQVLARVPRPEGFIGAHVVERTTGQILAALGAPPGPSPVPGPGTGTAMAPDVVRDLAQVVAQTLRRLEDVVAVHGGDDDLEDLVITWSGHHHLVRVLPGIGGEVLVLLTLDRSRANLALARHLLRRLEVELVP